MLVSELSDSKSASTDKTLKPLFKVEVDEMEVSNIWWVEENKIHIFLKNPTKHSIKQFSFSLSDTDCKSNGKKRVLHFELPSMLEAENSVVYSSELPFNYLKAIGNGTKCGVIESAYIPIAKNNNGFK